MSAWLFLLACVLLGPSAGLEPGKGKEDFESIEEVNSQEDTTATEQEPEDTSWVPEAVLDVAYYLRKFKFNGYDPRYLTEGASPERVLFGSFPSPPLRTIHWEVKKNCEASFIGCLRYLQEKVTQTELPRHLDSLTVIKHNGWSMVKDQDLIRATNEACLELRERDEKTFNVFPGPLQKFQWLTSASYYMCWYSMREVPHLKAFFEECDNFADCLDWATGPSNRDVRADNTHPFACATYSFCPEPCCPERLVRAWDECSRSNPCARHKPIDPTCFVNRSENVDFDSLTLNFWNVTCNCDGDGMEWESRSGMCVDVDECIEYEDACQAPAESCVNLPGGYMCVCSLLGYERDADGNCVPDPIVQGVINPPKAAPQHKNKTVADTFFDFVYHLKSVLSVSDDREDGRRSDALAPPKNSTP